MERANKWRGRGRRKGLPDVDNRRERTREGRRKGIKGAQKRRVEEKRGGEKVEEKSIATCERSLSKFKLLNYLRNTDGTWRKSVSQTW